MADLSKIKLPSGTTYNIKDNNALPLTGGSVTGPVSFGDSVSIDEATVGDLVVNGSASFTNGAHGVIDKAKAADVTSTLNALVRYEDTEGTFSDSNIYNTSNNLIIGSTSVPGNIQIGAKNDNYGILPNTNNYNQIGSSSLYWYRSFVSNYYGTNSHVTNWDAGKNIGTSSTSSAAATLGSVYFYNTCAAGGTQTKTLLSNGSASSNITITLPSTAGTLALTNQIPDISGKSDKSATVSTVAYDSTNKKITKTINGTTTDVVTVATLKTALGSMPASDVYSWAKASTKPTYTASEVGALASDTTYVSKITTTAGAHTAISNKSGAVSFNVPTTAAHVGAATSNHTHGNITNGGDITATAPTIASGDQIIINDNSASKVTNGPTFDGSTTTTALTPKGTWENFSKFSGSYNDLTNKPTIPSVAALLDVFYPVGTIYETTADPDTFNPNTAWGGEWTQIKDKFLLSAGDTYIGGSSGGSSDAVVVSHTHPVSITSKGMSANASHSHNAPNTDYPYFIYASKDIQTGDMGTQSGSGRHYLYQATNSNSKYWAKGTVTGSTSVAHTHNVTGDTGSTGVDTATVKNTNMPPYLVVYVWKRIA